MDEALKEYAEEVDHIAENQPFNESDGDEFEGEDKTLIRPDKRLKIENW